MARGFSAILINLESQMSVAMNIQQEMIHRIQAVYPDAKIELTDMTGTADHWQAVIVSSHFEGMGRLARQRSIYAALGELMSGPIHALTFKTLTPKQQEEEI